MAEGRLTLVQAERVYTDLDIKNPSPEVMRSALKVIGKAYEDQKAHIILKQEIITLLRGEVTKLQLSVENLDERLKSSELLRRMLTTILDQGVSRDEKKNKMIKKIQKYLKKLE